MHAILSLYPGDAVAALVASVLLQSTILLGVALLAMRRLGRGNAALRQSIPRWALAGLVLTPLAAWALQGRGPALVVVPIPAAAAAPMPHRTVPLEHDPTYVPPTDDPSRTPWPLPATPSVRPGAKAQILPAPLSAADGVRIGLTLFGLAWIAGSVLFFLRLVHGWGVQSVLRRGARALDPSAHVEILMQVRRVLGTASLPPLATTDMIESPLAVGCLRPMVVLPHAALSRLEARELGDILIHECAHVLQGDLEVGLLQRAVEAVLWFHPLLHALNRELALAREEVCDNYVLQQSAPADYARVLLGLAEKTSLFHPTPALVGLAHPRWKLEDRIRGILDKQRQVLTGISRGAVCLIVAAYAAVATLVAGGGIGIAQEPMPATRTEAEAPPGPATPTPAADPTAEATATPAPEAKSVADLLQTPIPEIDLADTEARTLLQALFKATGANLIYNPAHLAGRSVTLHARGLTLEQILKALEPACGLRYKVEGNAIVVFHSETAAPAPGETPAAALPPVASAWQLAPWGGEATITALGQDPESARLAVTDPRSGKVGIFRAIRSQALDACSAAELLVRLDARKSYPILMTFAVHLQKNGLWIESPPQILAAGENQLRFDLRTPAWKSRATGWHHQTTPLGKGPAQAFNVIVHGLDQGDTLTLAAMKLVPAAADAPPPADATMRSAAVPELLSARLRATPDLTRADILRVHVLNLLRTFATDLRALDRTAEAAQIETVVDRALQQEPGAEPASDTAVPAGDDRPTPDPAPTHERRGGHRVRR